MDGSLDTAALVAATSLTVAVPFTYTQARLVCAVIGVLRCRLRVGELGLGRTEKPPCTNTQTVSTSCGERQVTPGCYVGRTSVVRDKGAAGLDIYNGGTLINRYGGCEWGSRQSLYAQITTHSIKAEKYIVLNFTLTYVP
jgi:hypothetical protein